MTLQKGQRFRRLVAREDRLPASEYNKLTDSVEVLLKSQPALGFASSSGLSLRRMPAAISNLRAYAEVIETLRREDTTVVPTIEKRDRYEIELLSARLAAWAAGHGTYYPDDLVKFSSKVYKCKIQHESSNPKDPNNGTYWELSTHTEAWVWGYTEDLLEAIPWIQPGELVEVMLYDHPNFPERKWWILGYGPTKVQDGDDYSIMWDGHAKAVFG